LERHVASDPFGPAPEGRDLLRHASGSFGIEVADDDGRTSASERVGSGSADATARSGENGGRPVDRVHQPLDAVARSGAKDETIHWLHAWRTPRMSVRPLSVSFSAASPRMSPCRSTAVATGSTSGRTEPSA